MITLKWVSCSREMSQAAAQARWAGIDYSATITPEALDCFQALADEAERDISKLPEGSQPFWFRNRLL